MLKNNNPAWFADIKGGLALPCQGEINVYKPQGNIDTMPLESEAQTGKMRGQEALHRMFKNCEHND